MSSRMKGLVDIVNTGYRWHRADIQAVWGDRQSLRRHTLTTFITSSPKWLITFTAIRPDCGFSNGPRHIAVERAPSVRGFTLLELMVVLALLGLIVAIALPNLQTLYDSVTRNTQRDRILDQITVLGREAALGAELGGAWHNRRGGQLGWCGGAPARRHPRPRRAGGLAWFDTIGNHLPRLRRGKLPKAVAHRPVDRPTTAFADVC